MLNLRFINQQLALYYYKILDITNENCKGKAEGEIANGR